MNRKLFSLIMALVMVATCLVPSAMATTAGSETSATASASDLLTPVIGTADGTLVEAVQAKDNTTVDILVSVGDGSTTFTQTGDIELAVAAADEQRSELYAAENHIETVLNMAIEDAEYFSLAFNGFAFTGEKWMVDAINEIEGLSAIVAPCFQILEPEVDEEVVNLTPSMSVATEMTGAISAWDLGYTGKGMVVAVIDSGIRQTHEAFSVTPEGARMDKAYVDGIFAKYGDLMHGKNPEGAYYSAKLPYNWDYFDGDHIPNHTNSDHGSHVAGIVAGNNGKEFKGIAPDAQIISMQISNSAGALPIAYLLSAMEDAAYLGVDAINLSLGIAKGFETYQWPANFEPVFTALEQAGVAVCVAAGNDAHSSLDTMYGNYGYNVWQWLTTNPDTGMTGTPGTYPGSFTVGNTDNASKSSFCLVYIGGYNNTNYMALSQDPETPPLRNLGTGTYDLVNAGKATAEDLAAAGDLTGKVALITTAKDSDTTAQCAAAAEAGAIGIIICAYSGQSYSKMNVHSTIPLMTMSGADGTFFIGLMKDNKTTLKLNTDFDYMTVKVANTSSWGPTGNLKMKPEISAPGTKIMSVDGDKAKNDSTYVSMSGTSMATPAVAGGVMLLKQYLKEQFPEATGKEIMEKSYALMMSTAEHINAFVRQQGAGLMNLEKALETQVYLTTENNTRPKLELDDSETGVFEIAFKVTNFGDTTKTYDISHYAITNTTVQVKHEGYHTSHARGKYTAEQSKLWNQWLVNPTIEKVNVCNTTIKDVTSWSTLEGDKRVTVNAGETVTVRLTLKATEKLMQFMEISCPAGLYLEGWINLTDTATEEAVNLSIPFLGFVGDWDYPAIIDEGWWWQEPYGVNNMAQMYVSNVKGGIFAGAGMAEQGLGLNYYWDCSGETYLADRNALSPNGDGYLDELTDLEFSLLRNPRRVHIYFQYEDGRTTTYLDWEYSLRKESYAGSGGMSYTSFNIGYNLQDMAENETATLVMETYLDRDEYKLENNKFAKVEIPFTKDTIAPVVTPIEGGVEIRDANYVAYYAIYADGKRTQKVFEDGVFATERGVAETYMTDMDEYFVAVADYAHNEAFYYVKDGTVYEVDAEGFDHGRTIIGLSHHDIHSISGFTVDKDPYYAWFAFSEDMMRMPDQLTEAATSSDDDMNKVADADIFAIGKAADGTVYGSSMGYLYKLDPVTFERTQIAKYTTADYKNASMYAFGVAPGTNELYGVVVYNGQVNSSNMRWFCSINPEDGSYTELWPSFNLSSYRRGFAFYDADTIILHNKSGSGASKGKFELVNVHTGEVEEILDVSTIGGSSQMTGGMYGYIEPMMYDDETNCIYLGGSYSYNRTYRSGEQIVMKIDLTTGQFDYLVPGVGSGNGYGLFALAFLDELVDMPEQEHVCYIKEVVAPTCTEDGYTLKVCAECGEEIKENVVAALGHDYETVVTEPTCTELGYTTYTCKNCGDTYKDNYKPATNHKYGEWQTVKAATCTEKGQEKRVCTCGAEEFRDVDAKGHDYKKTVTEPTCTAMGYTTYTCSVCNDTYKADYVDAKGHDYKKTVTEPTCTEMGYTTYTCSVCKDSYKSDFTAPVAHKYGDWETVTAPTCTTEGQEKRTCECGAAEYRSTGKVGHKYESVVTEPTCTAMGYTTYTCSVCQDTYKTDFVAPVAHKYAETVTAPTCTEMGYTTYTCACGDTYKDNYVAPTGHKYGDWETVKEATCTAKGQEKRSCKCGAAEYRDTDMVAHKYTETVTAPTCTEMGYTTYTCSCGHSYVSNYVAPTGHKFGEWTVTKEATCTEKGEETRTCACGEKEVRATDKADHEMEEVVTAPTCTEVGYTTHACANCDYNYITDLTQPTGHDYETTVTAPTCTEDGYTTYTCAVCGESYVDDIVPATGHTFGEWVLTTEPGCTEAGEETRYCADCDAAETREVAPICPAEKFSDVDTKQWYHEGVCYVIRNGLMNGKSETVFAPNANLTRAELVTVLYRMAGSPSVEDLEHPFTDVAVDTWYTDAVIWAYNAEVVKGISNTAFAPNANITREQIATILYRYAGAEAVEEDSLKDFADAGKVNAYAVDAMNWAVSVGLINGMDDATLAPQGNATRAQIATILMRYCEG